MDQMNEIAVKLAEKFPVVVLPLGVLGSIVVLISVFVAATNTKADDAWWEKVKAIPFLGVFINFCLRFSLIAPSKPVEKK